MQILTLRATKKFKEITELYNKSQLENIDCKGKQLLIRNKY